MADTKISSLTPLDATRHKSLVREHAADIHNVNFTVAEIWKKSADLCSKFGSRLSESDQSRVENIMKQSRQTFDKFGRKYQPSTPAKDEKLLTSEEAYWVFFAFSGSDFDKSVQMADELTKALEQLVEMVNYLEDKLSTWKNFEQSVVFPGEFSLLSLDVHEAEGSLA
jgi:hypothetical protein